MDRDMRDRDNRQEDERDMVRSQGRAAGNARQDSRQGEEEYELDELVEILRIILTEESRAVPMKKYLRMVDVDKALYYLDSMERQMPRAIPEARRMLEDRNTILGNAERKAQNICKDAETSARVVMDEADKNAQAIKAEAEAQAAQIIDEAKKRARALVDQNEVSRLAETEATQKLAAARSKAYEIMRQATQYADTMLSNLEDFLKTELGDVQKSRDNLTEKR